MDIAPQRLEIRKKHLIIPELSFNFAMGFQSSYFVLRIFNFKFDFIKVVLYGLLLEARVSYPYLQVLAATRSKLITLLDVGYC